MPTAVTPSAIFETQHEDAYVDVGPDANFGRLGRYDLATGQLRATGPTFGESIWDVVARGTEVWALVGTELLVLDADTLEVNRTVPLDICGDMAAFVRQASDVYVLDDCDGTLLRLDRRTGRPSAEWLTPHDNFSDREITAFPTTDGIWFVDVEQYGVPYFFDTCQQRFERLPMSESQLRTVYALDFAVFPGPTREAGSTRCPPSM